LKVKGRLEHTISRVPVDGWKSAEDMLQKAEPVMGDYVIHDDWIGQVRGFNAWKCFLTVPRLWRYIYLLFK